MVSYRRIQSDIMNKLPYGGFMCSISLVFESEGVVEFRDFQDYYLSILWRHNIVMVK